MTEFMIYEQGNQNKKHATRTGLIADIYIPADLTNCSNGGISARYKRVTVTGDGIEGPFAPAADRPEVALLPALGGGSGFRAVPTADRPQGTQGPMFGGCFIYCCDSRFPSREPIALHDRYEVPSDYRD